MILASQSPRRKQLLLEAGFDLSIYPANIDEKSYAHESPIALVERLARTKAQTVARVVGSEVQDELLIAADTIVWQGDSILGKPHDPEDAKRMLRQLSGARHHVSSGVCLMYAPRTSGWQSTDVRSTSFVETSDVSFYPLSEQQIDAYVASGEPADKAGAYGIQGKGRLLVREISVDYFNIVGLPVARVIRELERLLPRNSQLLETCLR